MSKKILEKRDEYFQSALNPEEACIKEWSEDAALFLDQGNYTEALFWDRHWGDFSFFADCGQSIRRLDLYNNDKMISGVAHLKDLEYLIVRFKNKDKFDYASLPNLKTLEFIWCAKSGMSALTHPTLKNMSIDYLPDKDFQPVNTSLESLFLVTSKIKNFSFLQNFTQLKGIRVQGSKHIESLQGLPPSLERLHIDNMTKLTDFSALAETPNMNDITLRNACQVPKLPQEVYELPLTVISWLCEPIEVDWAALIRLPEINRIALTVWPDYALTDDEFASIAEAGNKKITQIQRTTQRKSSTILVVVTPK